MAYGTSSKFWCSEATADRKERSCSENIMVLTGQLEQVKLGRVKTVQLVIIFPLTSDVEAQLHLDIAVGISDGVAPLVSTCDSLEYDVLFADADSSLVALP